MITDFSVGRMCTCGKIGLRMQYYMYRLLLPSSFISFDQIKGKYQDTQLKLVSFCVLEIRLRKYFIIMKCIQLQSSQNKFSVKLGSFNNLLGSCFSILMYHQLQISTDLQRCKGLSKTCQESEECLFNFSSASV